MNIVGLGEAIIEDFFNLGFIKNIPDIYKLDRYVEKLKTLEGYGEKSINNLLNNIEESKKNSLDKLLFALGIRYVGKKTGKILAKKYKNIDNLKNASLEELINIKDIGEVIANSVYEYFNNDENILMIEELKKLNLNMEYLGNEIDAKTEFTDKIFVLTGSLESITREEAKEIIESLGGNVTGSVSKKTNVVIAGKDPGSKYNKAIELQIDIWNEEQFLQKIKK